MASEDETQQVVQIRAEIWRLNNKTVKNIVFTEKPVVQFTLDSYLETADIDTENNLFPEKAMPTRFRLCKQKKAAPPKNLRQQQREVAGKINTNGCSHSLMV